MQVQTRNLSKTADDESDDDESDDDMPILDDLAESSLLDGKAPPNTAKSGAAAASGAMSGSLSALHAKLQRLQAMVTMLQSTRHGCGYMMCTYIEGRVRMHVYCPLPPPQRHTNTKHIRLGGNGSKSTSRLGASFFAAQVRV